MRTLLVIVALSACASRTVAPPRAAPELPAGSAAFFAVLGDELFLDLDARGIRLSRRTLDVKAWKLDDELTARLVEEAKYRGHAVAPLAPAPEALESALKVREGRWKRTLGRRSQALMDLLFRAAEEKGVATLLLVLPAELPEGQALHGGPVGVFCQPPKEGGRAYAYFSLEFTRWDVAARKVTFRETVKPSTTEALTFAECTAATQLADPARQLEDPVKKTLGLVAPALLDKMGWKPL